MGLYGKSLYVLTPMYGGQLTVNYHHSYTALQVACQHLNIDMGSNNIYNESLISRARNRLVDAFLKETAHTHACFIDADIGFDPKDIISMLEMDEPILGVPCTKKSIRWDRIQIAIAMRAIEWARKNPQNGKEDLFEQSRRYLEGGTAIPGPLLPKIGGDFVMNMLDSTQNIQLDRPEPMRQIGTGLLMIRREVFQKFMRAYPDRWYEARFDGASNPGRIHDFFKCGVNPETRQYDSEDYWFIHDCMAIGYKAMLCPWIRTTHMGSNMFEGDLPAALGSVGHIF